MNAFGCGMLLVIVALPVAWIASEFRSNRAIRIILGIVSMIVVTASVAGLWNLLSIFQYNAEFGLATKDLIEASVGQIEDGHLERVLKAWRGLNAQYQPTYENRAHYPELAVEATALIRGERQFVAGASWDAGPFDMRTWIGHWEDDTGYWIVISASGGRNMEVWRSGNPPTRMQAGTLSDDLKTLTFQEGNQWRHTLTLTNKYESSHEWFDLAKGQVWRKESMHRLIRAAVDQKRQTQQNPEPK
jgi:hypothetical protein